MCVRSEGAQLTAVLEQRQAGLFGLLWRFRSGAACCASKGSPFRADHLNAPRIVFALVAARLVTAVPNGLGDSVGTGAGSAATTIYRTVPLPRVRVRLLMPSPEARIDLAYVDGLRRSNAKRSVLSLWRGWIRVSDPNQPLGRDDPGVRLRLIHKIWNYSTAPIGLGHLNADAPVRLRD
jgi:hypothetical protein